MTQDEFDRRMLRYLVDAERRYRILAEETKDPWHAELRDKAVEMAAELRERRQ